MAGRSKYTAKLAAEICERIASGQSLRQICRDAHMPHIVTVLTDWQDRHPEFSVAYHRAQKTRLAVLAEEIITLADEPREGVRTEKRQVGWRCPACGLAARWMQQAWQHTDAGTPLCEGVRKPERVVELKKTTGDNVERSKLRIDTRKWLLSRLAAAEYGDRLAVGGDATNPTAIQLVVMQAGAKEPDPDE